MSSLSKIPTHLAYFLVKNNLFWVPWLLDTFKAYLRTPAHPESSVAPAFFIICCPRKHIETDRLKDTIRSSHSRFTSTQRPSTDDGWTCSFVCFQSFHTIFKCKLLAVIAFLHAATAAAKNASKNCIWNTKNSYQAGEHKRRRLRHWRLQTVAIFCFFVFYFFSVSMIVFIRTIFELLPVCAVAVVFAVVNGWKAGFRTTAQFLRWLQAIGLVSNDQMVEWGSST